MTNKNNQKIKQKNQEKITKKQAKILKKKKKIKEIQVEMSEREQGTSSFNVGHTIRYMCRMIISIFFIQPFRKRK